MREESQQALLKELQEPQYKLSSHNQRYKETIDFLEKENRDLKFNCNSIMNDTKAVLTLGKRNKDELRLFD